MREQETIFPNQSRQFLFKNQFSLDECESLDSRPSKVRKKLFNFQLPAEVYVDCDDGDDLLDYKVPDISRYTSDHVNGKGAPEIRIMFSLGSSGVSTSSARLRDSAWLTDMNEPVYFQESSSPLPVGAVNSSSYSRVNKRGPVSHVYETGSSNNVGSLSRDLLKDKLPLPHHPFQGILNPLHHSPGIYPTCNIKDLSRNESLCVDCSDRIHLSHFRPFEPLVASENPNPPFNNPPSSTSSLSFWTKAKTSFTEPKPITPPESKLLPSTQNQDPFTLKCQVDASSRLNSCLQGGNGFCLGFSAGSKNLQAPPSSVDKTNRGFGGYATISCRKDAKPVRDIDLNEAVSDSSDEQVLLQDLNEPFMSVSTDGAIPRKYEFSNAQNAPKKSWILAPEVIACTEEQASLVSMSSVVNCCSEKKNFYYRRKNTNIDINLACEDYEQMNDEEMAVRKCIEGTCCINLNSCTGDSEDPMVSSIESKSNSCKVTLEIVSVQRKEDFIPSYENGVETVLDDVLTSAADAMVAISSSCREDQFLDADSTLSGSLLWFIDAVTSCAAVRELPLQDFTESGDEFEEMTLQLAEIEEENYMPRPCVSTEDGVAASTQVTRAQRGGQSRRGRQRRDFQRDILPGLTSLSRHEVSKDLQTFGGLMKATSHGWNSGWTRSNGGRNRGGRGRPRAVVESGSVTATVCGPLIQQLSTMESGMEDMSVAGWGRITRHPIQQSCPA